MSRSISRATLLAAGLVTSALAASALTTTAAGAVTSGVPFGALDSVHSGPTGVRVTGWAIDPDTHAPMPVSIMADGRILATITAKVARADVARDYGKFGGNHGFDSTYVLASGTHQVCARARNVTKQGHDSTGSDKTVGCRTVQVVTNPAGHVDAIARRAAGAKSITVTGWAADPQTLSASLVRITVDSAAPVTVRADRTVKGLTTPFPGMSTAHGFSRSIPVSPGSHRVSVVAVNVGLGADVRLGTVVATPAGATVPTAPTAVSAHAGTNAATVSWHAPNSLGGMPLTGYLITSSPKTVTTTVSPTTTSATIKGLTAGSSYRFTVSAVNLIGTSAASSVIAAVQPTAPVITASSPALISTSRYIRNIHGVSSDTTTTRAMGVADGAANPSNHRYLSLLQIGGQSTTGVVLTASSIYVSYARTVTAMEAYLDGYASTQHSHAPATIAFGTNNDMDVRSTTGALWAQKVVNPLVSYAKRYPNITVAGANDIEAGFRGSVGASEAWVQGFLGATSATFVFNGSADGCSWTRAHSACNNGWRANSIAWMAGGYAPTRTLALPQIYNTTMAKQWRYVSITAIENGRKKINFAGPLTEYTACVLQHGGCGSMTNNTAWTALWGQLQIDSRARQTSLPYGTDLRIN
jgi:fibronectin type III domain protein